MTPKPRDQAESLEWQRCASRLRDAMAGWTIPALALVSNVSQSYIYQLRTGRCRPASRKTLERLASALCRPVEALLP